MQERQNSLLVRDWTQTTISQGADLTGLQIPHPFCENKKSRNPTKIAVPHPPRL